ncbi:MAG TPA: TIGR02757 family protein [Spirochaetales bacterium]|nr:TIGR02757 family protein [Spirochaetales bacterium]
MDPDPLAVTREYVDPGDREVAGLAAACLALGSAPLIVRAAREVLAPLGSSPADALGALGDDDLARLLSGFRYRFFGGEDLAALLSAVRNARARHGSLEVLFRAGDDPSEPTIIRGADRFAAALEDFAGSRWIRVSGKAPWRDNLLPRPSRGSACKRLFLYLRWMVRKDAVDPGGWTGVSPSRLVVPLDTHMGAACRRLGLVTRRADDLKAALEATEAFRRLRPDDPVRYDFALTRPGIHPCLEADAYFRCFDDPEPRPRP